VELSWSREHLIEKFIENLVEQTAVVHRCKDYVTAADTLTEIATLHRLHKVLASTDGIIETLNLRAWAEKAGVNLFFARDFSDRDSYKDFVFDGAEAGITGVDYAIAESGTLCIVHDKNQPRLVSLAPITHIAVVPVERIYPVYEQVIENVFGKDRPPHSHVTFITGPSMTADIQGVPFKGMHGPKRLIVILVG
jgi:L-lactate dehydrogenase complex protein LldG